MADIVSPETRSKIMRAVGSRNTSIEMRLRRALWHGGWRYRVHRKVDGIEPDICFVGSKVAVFVDGCFWHGCPNCYRQPASNSEYWTEKLRTNRERDRRQTERLQESGWTVLRFWGCEVKDDVVDVVESISSEIE